MNYVLGSALILAFIFLLWLEVKWGWELFQINFSEAQASDIVISVLKCVSPIVLATFVLFLIFIAFEIIDFRSFMDQVFEEPKTEN